MKIKIESNQVQQLPYRTKFGRKKKHIGGQNFQQIKLSDKTIRRTKFSQPTRNIVHYYFQQITQLVILVDKNFD